MINVFCDTYLLSSDMVKIIYSPLFIWDILCPSHHCFFFLFENRFNFFVHRFIIEYFFFLDRFFFIQSFIYYYCNHGGKFSPKKLYHSKKRFRFRNRPFDCKFHERSALHIHHFLKHLYHCQK